MSKRKLRRAEEFVPLFKKLDHCGFRWPGVDQNHLAVDNLGNIASGGEIGGKEPKDILGHISLVCAGNNHFVFASRSANSRQPG